MNDLWIALIGIFGVLLGAGFNELLRKNRRIEVYSPYVFEKRLKKYEELFSLLQEAYSIASDVMDSPDLSQEERHHLISATILSLARFTDQNQLYIEPDLGAHCVATFMGAEGIQAIEDPEERKKRTQSINNMYMSAKRMIREDSGIVEIEKLFKRIAKPKLSGPMIEQIQHLREHPEKMQREIKGQ